MIFLLYINHYVQNRLLLYHKQFKTHGKSQSQFALQVEKKFHSLRTQFAAELKNEERRKSGSEGGNNTSKWQYMNSLLFLRRGMKKRKGVCTEIGMLLYILVLPRHFSMDAHKIFSKFLLYFSRRTRVAVAALQ